MNAIASKRSFEEATQALRTADREIDAIHIQRKERQAELEKAERRAKSLTASGATSELKIKQQNELDAIVAEIARLQNLIRLATDEIAKRQAARELLVPAFQQSQKELAEAEERKELDALNACINVCAFATQQAQKALTDCIAAEEKARFAYECRNDQITTRKREVGRIAAFTAANARRLKTA
jgi:CHAT domain-containing protein